MPDLTFLTCPSPGQISQIIALYRTAGWWIEGVDTPKLVAKIIAGSHRFVVATEKGDKIVGMGRAISDGVSDAYIQDVIVDRVWRGQGIGAEIVEKLVACLRHDGLKWIGIIAEKESYKFYEKIGFKQMEDSIPLLRMML